MLPNYTHALLCSKQVINDAIKCDVCGFWVHRKCAKMTIKQLTLKSNPLYYYFCKNCVQEFPFMQIDNDELTYMYFKNEMNENVYKIYNQFKDKSLKYCDTELQSLFIDPDEFYSEISNVDCEYYLEENCREVLGCLDGLSMIHFNARSLKANFRYIKDYVKKLNKNFHIIAISETWF